VILAGGWYVKTRFNPMPEGSKITLQFENSTAFNVAVQRLEASGIVRDANAVKLFATLTNMKRTVQPGSYDFRPGMSITEVLRTMGKPNRRMVYVPEGRWIARIARGLEDKRVIPAKEYIEAASHPEKYDLQGLVPAGKTLEGLLYPDTYNFPEGTKAEFIIKRQLMNFFAKTDKLGLTKSNLKRVITIASLLELEASDFNERKMIAGVIENRLKAGMKLQIDATINYAMQKWRPLYYKDYSMVKSPYNTYLYTGLPPGPICSPTKPSIEAALNPTKHNFVYYITMPDGVTLFSATYPEHMKNVRKRDALKAAKTK
jgi:UPF0755 protein